jgi:4-hydroxybutyryl-CoA dehydratase / vinylacetyl-CoA-Delta-isomerase
MPQVQSTRVSAVSRQVLATKAEIDVEDLVKRAWPDGEDDVKSPGCNSCSGCASSSSASPVYGLVPNSIASSGTNTPLQAMAWPKHMPVQAPEIVTAEDYIKSLRGRNLKVYLFGELLKEFVDHPIIWPSVNAMAETYRLAQENPQLASAVGFSGVRVSRFLHIAESAEDLVLQSQMQRELGRRTGTCFQRCVGMDASNAVWSTTYDIDKKHGTNYHSRFQAFMTKMQKMNYVIGGAMTDPKGDRMLSPSQQEDPDVFVRITERRPDGSIVLRGAKAHQTGVLNSHWMIIMPGGKLEQADKDFAVTCAIPVDAKGITYIYGRQSCDLRAMEEGDVDQGNAKFGGQEALVIFEDVEVPAEYVFMDGEIDFTGVLVERFTAYHRRSYICKAGLGDVMLGAAATVADYNGVAKATHIKDKLVEIAYLNENISGTALAASYGGSATASGCFLPDVLMANICKHNVTRIPFEIARLAQDLAGGFVVTLPSDKDCRHEVAGPLCEKYLKGKKGVTVENRRRILRLIENMTLGRNAVGYLSESLHGAGSPQAQRILISRLMKLEDKKRLAKALAGITE